jgi:hypothetical protein
VTISQQFPKSDAILLQENAQHRNLSQHVCDYRASIPQLCSVFDVATAARSLRGSNPHTRRRKTKSRWHNADKFSSFPGPSACSQYCMHVRQDTASCATWADAWRGALDDGPVKHSPLVSNGFLIRRSGVRVSPGARSLQQKLLRPQRPLIAAGNSAPQPLNARHWWTTLLRRHGYFLSKRIGGKWCRFAL